jgi:hypothetical protein
MGTAAPGPGNTRLRDNTITGVADSNRHAGHRHALSQDFRMLTQRLVAHVHRRYTKGQRKVQARYINLL